MIGSTALSLLAAVALAVSGGLLQGCAGSEPNAAKVQLGEEFTLRAGESARVGDNLRLTFEAVEEDSRCPENARCIWEGNARVRLGYVTPDYPPTSIALNTSARYARDTTVQRYHITLKAVLPPRRDGSTIDPKAYSARVIVENQ